MRKERVWKKGKNFFLNPLKKDTKQFAILKGLYLGFHKRINF